MTRSAVSLVVPVYNEQERFTDFADELVEYIEAQPTGSELLVVDDGSVDGTAELANRTLRKRGTQRARVLRRAHEGKGAALTAGIQASTAEIVAFCDIDLSTPLSDLSRIIDAAARAPVLAIGSRDVSGSVLARSQGPVRKALGRAYNRLMQATVTPGVVDTQCGAKAARAEVWSELLRYCSQQGFAWDAEVVGVALASGVEVQEIAITWHHDNRSQVNVMRDGLAMVRQTQRLLRSAATARAATEARGSGVLAATTADTSQEVFDATNAARMQGVDRTHWWFRSKAAFVATALRRTEGSAASPGWLVDAGGGSGGVSAMLGWPTDRVMVVEGNSDLVRTASVRSGLPAAQGLVHELPVHDGAAAVVCLLDVIEHLDDPGDALREASRALGLDGRLVVNVPAHQWLWSRADEELGHRRRYSRRELRNALRAVGFEAVVLTHVFSWLVPPVWFRRRVASTGSAELGLDRRSLPIDVASLALTAMERELIGRVSLPLGTSVLCVARRCR